jgi:hypothetical protein
VLAQVVSATPCVRYAPSKSWPPISSA